MIMTLATIWLVAEGFAKAALVLKWGAALSLYGGGGGDGGDGGAAAQEAQRQANINTGMSQISDIFSKYNDNFYNQRAQDYTNYAMPQLMNQYQQTRNNLTYALARNGQLNSGSAINRGSELNQQLNTNLNTVANTAQGAANTLRGQVSDARTNLTNQLIASSDPSVVAANGAAATAGLTSTPSFNSLGNMFGDWSNAYVANMNARLFNPQTPSLFSQLTAF